MFLKPWWHQKIPSNVGRYQNKELTLPVTSFWKHGNKKSNCSNNQFLLLSPCFHLYSNIVLSFQVSFQECLGMFSKLSAAELLYVGKGFKVDIKTKNLLCPWQEVWLSEYHFHFLSLLLSVSESQSSFYWPECAWTSHTLLSQYQTVHIQTTRSANTILYHDMYITIFSFYLLAGLILPAP